MSEQAEKPVKEKKVKAPKEVKEKIAKVEQNGVVRPNTGTTTAQVWEIAEDISNTAGTPVRRGPLLEATTAAGINPATAATQYGKWCKFHGIVFEKATKVAEEPAAE